MIFTINTDQCIFCGVCAFECPAGVITIEKSSGTAVIEPENCIECSHCGMVCPEGAVRADGERLPEYPADTVKSAASEGVSGAFEHLIRSKRSVRSYKPDPIRKSDLEAILRSGSMSATATNSRQVRAIVLQTDEVRELGRIISAVLLRVVKFGLNPVGRGFLKLFGLRRYARKELLESYQKRIADTLAGRDDAFFFNAPALVILTYPATSNGRRFGRTDCALAGENMMLTAHSRGIGSCMIGFAEAALFTAGLRKKAGVSGDRRIGLIFTLGYQKPVYRRYPVRDEWKLQTGKAII